MDKRNIGGKLIENFFENCLRFPKIFNSNLFLGFLTIKDSENFHEYIQKYTLPAPSLYFAWRKMGKKAPIDEQFNRCELMKYYKDLRPQLFHAIKSSGDLIYNQMSKDKIN